jgi:hypothetical protein
MICIVWLSSDPLASRAVSCVAGRRKVWRGFTLIGLELRGLASRLVAWLHIVFAFAWLIWSWRGLACGEEWLSMVRLIVYSCAIACLALVWLGGARRGFASRHLRHSRRVVCVTLFRVMYGVSWLFVAIFGTLCRRQDDSRRESRRQLACALPQSSLATCSYATPSNATASNQCKASPNQWTPFHTTPNHAMSRQPRKATLHQWSPEVPLRSRKSIATPPHAMRSVGPLVTLRRHKPACVVLALPCLAWVCSSWLGIQTFPLGGVRQLFRVMSYDVV